MRRFARAVTAYRGWEMIGIALLLLVVYFIRHAAVTADAYVTFRVVDNATHGYGLRWNISERVQVYTHPFWMFLHIPFYALWENIFWITVVLSIVCALASLIVMLATFSRPWPQALMLGIVPFAASTTLTQSSMLGLENPLTHLLFACFGWVLLRAGERRFWFWLSFTCALALFNRLDTAFFYAPIMLWIIASRLRDVRWAQLVLGSLPIMLWEMFSLFYYGFLLPNTAYAKLPGGPFDVDAIEQGLHYLVNSMAVDITGFAVALIGLLGPLFRYGMHRRFNPRLLAVSAGILSYGLYVTDIGGTYLSGRLLSLCFFAGLWVMYGMMPVLKTRILLLIAAPLLAVRMLYPSDQFIRQHCPRCFGGELSDKWYHITPQGFPMDEATHTREALPTVNHAFKPWAAEFSGVGFGAYRLGPGLFAINPFSFNDPLLARLPNTGTPMTESVIWHQNRNVPAGYLDMARTGSMWKMDPALAQYYTKLRLIISGDLWDMNRLETIWRFNRGEYNPLLQDYISRHPG